MVGACPSLLHVPRDAVARSNRVGRQTDDRDRFALVKDSFDNLRVVDSHNLKSEKLTAKTPRSPRGPPITGLLAVFFFAILAVCRLIHNPQSRMVFLQTEDAQFALLSHRRDGAGRRVAAGQRGERDDVVLHGMFGLRSKIAR